jgi:hypothetical protein
LRVVGVNVLGHLALLRLRLDLELGSLLDSTRVAAEVIEEIGERRRGEKHASEIAQTLVLIHESSVLGSKVTILADLVGNFGLKLSNVFYKELA